MARITAAAKAANRERLLAMAIDEFAAHGVANAKVDRISTAAGLAKGTIYNYFDSKDDVFRAVVAVWADALESGRRDLEPGGSAWEQLSRLATSDFAAIAEHEPTARVAMRELLGGSSILAEIIPRFEAMDQQYADVMADGQRRGEIRRDRSADDLARVLVAMQNGLLLDRWLGNLDTPIIELGALVIDQFMFGVAPAASR